MNGKQITISDDKSDYIIYYPNDEYILGYIPINPEYIPDEGCQSVSIDIGIKHFAIRIEKRYRDGKIIPVLFEKIDFTMYEKVSERTGTTKISPVILMAAQKYIQSIMPILIDSRIIGIERQLSISYKNTRMFQHILSIMLIYVEYFKYPCIIMDINSKLKGQMLGAPKGLRGNDLKKWSIEKALDILKKRDDKHSLDIILKHKGKSKMKGDDLADTVLQMEAWHKLVGGVCTGDNYKNNRPINTESTYNSLDEYLINCGAYTIVNT